MRTFKKILCAVDLVEDSSFITAYAATMAKAFDASVLVLYVSPIFGQFMGLNVPEISIETVRAELFEEAEKKMGEFLPEHFAGIVAEGKVVNGDPGEEIIAEAEKNKADLMIMGTRGRSGFDRLLTGSVAGHVVKNSPVPVVTVRPHHTKE